MIGNESWKRYVFRWLQKTGNVETEVTSCGNHSEWVFSVKDRMYNVAINVQFHLMFSKTTFLPICVGHMRLSVATDRFIVASDRRKIAVGQMRENWSVSVRWESVK